MFHDVDQNSDDWFDLRCGKVTGSRISKIMAHYGKAFGQPAKDLAATIACERLFGDTNNDADFRNEHMERGHIQEPLARADYEYKYFVDVNNGGFFDNGNTGCSPDGLILDDGVLEIKSVLRHVHVKTISRSALDPTYKWQCIFNLKETGRDWLDFVSYCGDFPEGDRICTYRIERINLTDQFEIIDLRLKEFEILVDEAQSVIINGINY